MRWRSTIVWLIATASLDLGSLILVVAVVLGCELLMEGVTHRFGEGEIAAGETTEQVRNRLAVVGTAVAAATAGWVLARLGDAYRRPQGRGPRPARMAAELVLLLGVAGLGVGVLVAWGYRLAAYRVEEEYIPLGIGGAAGGAILFALGWLLYRRTRQPMTNSDPARM